MRSLLHAEFRENRDTFDPRRQTPPMFRSLQPRQIMPSTQKQNRPYFSQTPLFSASTRHNYLLGIMLSGVSAVVRPDDVAFQVGTPRTTADTLPLN